MGCFFSAYYQQGKLERLPIKREFGVYDYVKDNYPKYVLSTDELDFSRNGIRHENIRSFLLRNDW